MNKYSIKFNGTWELPSSVVGIIKFYDSQGNEVSDTLFASYWGRENYSEGIGLVFSNCTYLEQISLNELTYLMTKSFENCANLKSVTLGGNLVTIGEGCFNGCTALEAIYVNPGADLEKISQLLEINNPSVVQLLSESANDINPVQYSRDSSGDQYIPVAHADYTFTNNTKFDGKNTTVSEELANRVTLDQVELVKYLSWENDNVRFYGEKGSVYDQGFSEFYGFPSTQVELSVDGVLQEVVCLPNDNLVSANFNTVSGLVREFTLSDYENLKLYGGELSGTSMLGTEGMVNGIAGCMSIAVEKVVNFRTVERISFKSSSIYTNGESFARILQIDPGGLFLNGVNDVDIPLNGTIEGLPIIKVGEWFSWGIEIPANYDNSTLMNFYINGELTPIQVKAAVLNTAAPVDSCVAKLSTWPMSSSYSPLGSGCYSYHTNYGLTIMKEDSEKSITNSLLSSCGKLYIITPEGNIPVSVRILDTIDPLSIGHQFIIIGNNTPATINIYGNSSFLINGLRNTKIDIWRKMILDGINISSGGVNYYMDIISPVIP